MQFTAALFRQSGWWFTAVLILAVFAFWPRYLSRIAEQPDIRFHIHGLALGAWCTMLIVQAFLIRTGHRVAHRQLGKLSYFLAPIIALSILSLVQYRNSVDELAGFRLLLLISILGDVVLYTSTYSLAIVNRRQAQIHARYMVCTGIVVLPAILDRIFNFYGGLGAAPGEIPLSLILSLVVAEGLLAGLMIWDWKSGNSPAIFARMLVLFVGVHWFPFVVYDTGLGRVIGTGFMGLPIP